MLACLIDSELKARAMTLNSSGLNLLYSVHLDAAKAECPYITEKNKTSAFIRSPNCLSFNITILTDRFFQFTTT